MNDDKTKSRGPAGDRGDLSFAKTKRLWRGPRPVGRNAGDDDDAPTCLELPPEWRLDKLEGLVERIINVGAVKAALDADRWFEVLVSSRQLVPDDELTSDDRAWDPTGSLTYHLMAPDADTARERALDRFHREVPIKCLDHYAVTAEIAPHEDSRSEQ